MDRLLAVAVLGGVLFLPVAKAPCQELETPAATVGEDNPAVSMDVAAETRPAKCNSSRKTCCHQCCIDWKTVPGSIRPLHRPGNFPVPPTGCGHYSFCDALHGICRNKPVKNGYPRFALMPPAFFDADFRYLESKPLCKRNFSEKLKRRRLGDCMTFSTGGQFWARYMNESNSRLSPADNDYTLTRVRAYADLLVGENLRFFGEFIWADSLGEDLAPLPIDVNLGDALNLFVELNMFDYAGKPVYARVGRQELLFGSQRLVSTLDWANVRRTFDGVRIFRTGEQWDFDLFYTAFVPADPDDFDEPDSNREFAGAWATYRPKKGHFLDFFYLYFENSNDVVQQSIVRAPDRCAYDGYPLCGRSLRFALGLLGCPSVWRSRWPRLVCRRVHGQPGSKLQQERLGTDGLDLLRLCER